jgi:YrbI family 3-deoxy-D-manno-octulosonate 8-phosphate phosphatase
LPKKKIRFENLDAIVFDFDGVLTDNRVYLDQNGSEFVSCYRGDGLAFDVLRVLDKPTYILSTEKNPVVYQRAQKLKVPVLQSINNKADALSGLVAEKGYRLENILYVGNDLNDYHALTMCGYSACPADSHIRIKEKATVILKTLGGAGVARELLEDVLKIDIMKILFSRK